MRIRLTDCAIALALMAGAGALSLPVLAAETAADVDAGTRGDAAKHSERHGTQVEAERHKGGVDVSVDRDPAPRVPKVDRPGVDVDIDRD